MTPERALRHAKWRARQASEAWGRATAPVRMRPGFLVIGAMKAGTHAIFDYLRSHPGVLAGEKEIHYFDLQYDKSSSWYFGRFPSRLAAARVRRRLGYEPQTGEATPYYLFHPDVPPRVRETLPDVRLIALLRDPVDRALSHYHHEVAKGRETLPFGEAIEAEPGRIAQSTLSGRHNPYRRFSYLARGRYAEQLERWLAHFPREQLLVVKSEDLRREAPMVVDDVCRFIGLPPARLPSYPPRSVREYPPMEPQVRDRLARHFEEPNRRLYALLGSDLGWTRPV